MDHVNGGGSQWRKRITGSMEQADYILSHQGEFQLLCANCNWIKRAEMKECPVLYSS
jgi:hypothetical protein